MIIDCACPICGQEIEVIVAIVRESGGWVPLAETISLPCHRLTDTQTETVMETAESKAIARLEREDFPTAE